MSLPPLWGNGRRAVLKFFGVSGPEQLSPPLNIEKEIRARTDDTLSFVLSSVRRSFDGSLLLLQRHFSSRGLSVVSRRIARSPRSVAKRLPHAQSTSFCRTISLETRLTDPLDLLAGQPSIGHFFDRCLLFRCSASQNISHTFFLLSA